MYAFQKEFQLDPTLCYLNHAAVAPWPLRTVQAVTQFAQENMHKGASRYPHWLKTEQTLREHLRALINAQSTDDIALLKNTSEALSFVAQGLEWQQGDEVLISSDEFPSNRIVWEALAAQGVRVVEADLHGNLCAEDAILACIGPHTRLVSVSSIQYASGIRLDLNRLGIELRQRNILFCVDAIQSIGAVQFDVMACHADFVMADGHKWMLGPEGIALFYTRPESRDRLRLLEYGWHMVKNRGNYDVKAWQPASNATRFECGSPNMLGTQALEASLSLLLEVGMDTVERLLLDKIQHLAGALSRIQGLSLVSPTEPGRHGGILTFKVAEVDSVRLYQELMRNGVICANRGGGVRFSPHFYTETATLDWAVDKVDEICKAIRCN